MVMTAMIDEDKDNTYFSICMPNFWQKIQGLFNDFPGPYFENS